jgi:nucleoside-diphosphate-sugar epimerase
VNVLVTGGFGNIGASAVEELVRQGHRVRVLELPETRRRRAAARLRGSVDVVWGDIRRPADARAAAEGQDVLVHLAGILPPDSDEHPALAEEVNVGGTRTLLAAARGMPTPPRVLYTSTLHVFGPTAHLAPPRRVTDPVRATDPYTHHKLACEDMVRCSGLSWLIFRLAYVPHIALRKLPAAMFDVPLDTRIETLHVRDAAVAVANALHSEAAWGRILLVGGGPRCQLYFRDYLARSLTLLGIGPLPEEAFGVSPYPTDWLDTEESERLLHYQRHTFEDILDGMGRILGVRRYLTPIVRPFVRRSLLSLSPYWRAHTSDSSTRPTEASGI